jgi:death on curing protein
VAELLYLDRDDVQTILATLVERLVPEHSDPLPTFTLLGGEDRGGALLESALALPAQPYYETVYQKAAALLRSLAKNHPFIDGNKRAAVTVTLVFLLLNGEVIVASQQDLVEFTVHVAESSDLALEEISAWLQGHSVSIRELTPDIIEKVQNPDFGADVLRERLDLLKPLLGPPSD